MPDANHQRCCSLFQAADKQGAMASPSGATKLRGANVSDEENQGRRFSILMTTTVKVGRRARTPGLNFGFWVVVLRSASNAGTRIRTPFALA